MYREKKKSEEMRPRIKYSEIERRLSTEEGKVLRCKRSNVSKQSWNRNTTLKK